MATPASSDLSKAGRAAGPKALGLGSGQSSDRAGACALHKDSEPVIKLLQMPQASPRLPKRELPRLKPPKHTTHELQLLFLGLLLLCIVVGVVVVVVVVVVVKGIKGIKRGASKREAGEDGTGYTPSEIRRRRRGKGRRRLGRRRQPKPISTSKAQLQLPDPISDSSQAPTTTQTHAGTSLRSHRVARSTPRKPTYTQGLLCKREVISKGRPEIKGE